MPFCSDRNQQITQNVAHRAPATLHCAVTSKKGVMGFDSPMNHCDASRSLSRRAPAACSFAPPVFGGSDGEPQGSPVLARGARSVNPFEPPPPFDSGCVGFCKPHLLEAIHG